MLCLIPEPAKALCYKILYYIMLYYNIIFYFLLYYYFILYARACFSLCGPRTALLWWTFPLRDEAQVGLREKDLACQNCPYCVVLVGIEYCRLHTLISYRYFNEESAARQRGILLPAFAKSCGCEW